MADADRTQLIEKMVKLKRVATLYKSEGAKHKKALEDAQAQLQQRGKIIQRLKSSLLSMKKERDAAQAQAGAAAASEEGAAVHGVPKGAELVCGLGGQRPSHVLARVYSAGDHWCFVQFDNDDDEEDQEDDKPQDSSGQHSRRWMRQDLLETQAYEQFGIRLELPEVLSNQGASGMSSKAPGALESSATKAELEVTQENLERVQEEFRRYRVRAEIQRKQTETELNRIMQASVSFQQRRIAWDEGDAAKLRDCEQKLYRAEQEIEELVHSERH